MTTATDMHLLRALAAARAAMPTLVQNSSGEGANGQVFWYPSDDDLRVAATKALRDAGLELLPDEDAMTLGDSEDATLRWQLVHLETGETRIYKVTWARFDESGTRASAAAAWSAASTWTHATRHLLLKLLNVRVVSQADAVRLGILGPLAPVGAGTVSSAGYDRLVGELPAHMQLPAPAPAPSSAVARLRNQLAECHRLLATFPQRLADLENEGLPTGLALELRRRQDELPILLETPIERLRVLHQMADEAALATAGTETPAVREMPATAPAPVQSQPFCRSQIVAVLDRWKAREIAARRAVDPNAASPTIADAWGAATGGPPRALAGEDEFRRLYTFLCEDDARHGGAT